MNYLNAYLKITKLSTANSTLCYLDNFHEAPETSGDWLSKNLRFQFRIIHQFLVECACFYLFLPKSFVHTLRVRQHLVLSTTYIRAAIFQSCHPPAMTEMIVLN